MRRVLVDTNVILSAILFPESIPAHVFAHVLTHESLILTQWIITELGEVTARKRPDLVPALETLLSSIDYEIAEPRGSGALITDPDDQPILDAAIAADVDILISGDKHFLTLTLDRPAIMNARTYLTTCIEAT